MCRVLGVSTSGYYAWLKRPPSRRATRDAVLREKVCAFHERSRGTYGVYRIQQDLVEDGEHVSRKRIARLMREAGIQGVSRRRFVRTTVSDASQKATDLVDRDFTATFPDQLWVADITYVPTWCGFLYLAVVLDVFSRRVVGWSMRPSLHTEVVTSALKMAIRRRQPRGGVIHHSDHGCQYTSLEFGKRCKEAGVRPSMGSVGDCYDNAMCESFFATLECELIQRCTFRTHQQAEMEIFSFIEGFYNPRRRHSGIGYQSPVDFELAYNSTALAPSA